MIGLYIFMEIIGYKLDNYLPYNIKILKTFFILIQLTCNHWTVHINKKLHVTCHIQAMKMIIGI